MGLFDFLRSTTEPADAPSTKQPEPATPTAPSSFRHFLDALFAYGVHNDERSIPELRALYGKVWPELAEQERIELIMRVAELIESGKISINPLNVFLFEDPSPTVVASAVMNALPMWPDTTADDPFFGARELLGYADGFVQSGDEPRSVGLLQGLLLLGDRRLVDLVGERWRMLSMAGRLSLSHLAAPRVYAPVVDWLIDWLEQSEGREFAYVAAAVARHGNHARERGGVYELRRALPLWVTPAEPPITELQQWSLEEFADRIAPRLREIARLESGDRVMSGVLDAWGIQLEGAVDPNEREVLQRAMRRSRQDHGVIPEEALTASMPFPGVQSDLDDILAQQPAAFVAWGIFNPYGPTLSIFGRTQGRDVDFLWYVMLNPFKQLAIKVGTLTGADRGSDDEIARQFERLLAENVIRLANGGEEPLVTCPPCLILTGDDTTVNARRPLHALLYAPGVRSGNLYERLRCLERTAGNPWERATEQVHGRTSTSRDEGSRYADDEEVNAWAAVVLSNDQRIREMIAFREAWDGAIHNLRTHGDAAMADAAMSGAHFDYFTQAVGFPFFAYIAEAQREQ